MDRSTYRQNNDGSKKRKGNDNTRVQKSVDRRSRKASPKWSEEAVRGSQESAVQPLEVTTTTPPSFTAWIEEQQSRGERATGVRTGSPEHMELITQWLDHQQREEASTVPDTTSQPWSSNWASTQTSPITATDSSTSPLSHFQPRRNLYPQQAPGPPLPAQPLNPTIPGFEEHFNPQPHDQGFPTELLGVGSFLESEEQEGEEEVGAR